MRIFAFFLSLLLFATLLTGCGVQQPETWQMSLSRAINTYTPAAHTRLLPYFTRAGVNFPPQQLAILIFKRERRLELWARDNDTWVFIKAYPVLAASGGPGPKLRLGDDQVPEGIYRVVGLNPESHYHLSLNLNYPNSFDLDHARMDHRYQLGNDIFIHGNHLSIGCIAIGDVAIEELFVLVYKTGLHNTEVIIAPDDLRYARSPQEIGEPKWVPTLYRQISYSLSAFDGHAAGTA